MKRSFAAAVLLLAAWNSARAGDLLNFERFRRVALYQGAGETKSVVLFVSGDGGFDELFSRLAQKIALPGVLVAAVDGPRYLKALAKAGGKCLYPASDFEGLSKYLQKKRNLDGYSRPILVGHSSGAALVYALLAEAPPNTFQGAISLAFSPRLNFARMLCRGYEFQTSGSLRGEMAFLPAKSLQNPWIVLQGGADEVCPAAEARPFVEAVPGAGFVLLPEVGHGFKVEERWFPAYQEAFAKIADGPRVETKTEGSVKGLPLVEMKAPGAGDWMAVIVTGDGGWASIDRDIGNYLRAKEIPVVGLNSLKYFWKRREPDEMGRDLGRIINHYLEAWNKKKVVVIGYSRGADVAPFMVSRLPPGASARLGGLALLGPEHETQFEIRMKDLVGPGAKGGSQTLPEVRKLKGLKILCVSGDKEKDSLCEDVDPSEVDVVTLRGGHHFSGDYEEVGGVIARWLGLE